MKWPAITSPFYQAPVPCCSWHHCKAEESGEDVAALLQSAVPEERQAGPPGAAQQLAETSRTPDLLTTLPAQPLSNPHGLEQVISPH